MTGVADVRAPLALQECGEFDRTDVAHIGFDAHPAALPQPVPGLLHPHGVRAGALAREEELPVRPPPRAVSAYAPSRAVTTAPGPVGAPAAESRTVTARPGTATAVHRVSVPAGARQPAATTPNVTPATARFTRATMRSRQ